MTDVATIPNPNAASCEPLDSSGSRALLQRIQGEYLEMPGLTLTLQQAARLWGLSVRQSERLLFELVRCGFLMRDRKGAYRRSGCPRCS
jgi:hypothetical protein